jgi:subtilisin family serine protease
MANFAFLTLCLTITLISAITALSQNEPISDEKLSAHWLLKLDTDDLELAKSIAREHNFNVVRQVGRIEGYYIVESTHNDSRAKRDLADNHAAAVQASAQRISAHPSVEMFKREKLLTRTRRDFIQNAPLRQERTILLGKGASGYETLAYPNQDPYWNQMWYLNRNMKNSSLADMNVTAAWALGYSGRGVSVTFLDDGLEWNHPDLKQNYDPEVIHFLNQTLSTP